MKICPLENCKAANGDASKYCSECGSSLELAPSPAVASAPPPSAGPVIPASPMVSARRVDLGVLGAALNREARQSGGERKADVMFVLDCTSSMKLEIEGIKEVIIDFVDAVERENVRIRVGLVAFRDVCTSVPPEEPKVLSFAGSPFTSDAALFAREVGQLKAKGGGDLPESSLDALLLAVRQEFDPEAEKVLVLITDAPPHVPDREARSIEHVAEAIQAVGVRQLYLVIRVQDPASQVFLPLMNKTQGLAFDLGHGDDFVKRKAAFSKTLMSLGRTISTWTRSGGSIR